MAKMLKLLIITQKVDKNDHILGFFHRWLEEFAKNTEKLTVICLEKGEYNLPENVKVLPLGKKNLETGFPLGNPVYFCGPIPYPRIQDFYHSGDIFINLSETGSVDKAMLEAMSCGLLALTSNEAFRDILSTKYFLEERT